MKEFHPIANLFPLLEGKEYEEFAQSIKMNGLRFPITLLDNKVLEGRNRERACEDTGVEPRYEALAVDKDPYEFVADANLHRRHLNDAQRAFIAAQMATLQKGDNQYTKSGSANWPTHSREADRMKVSERQVRRAKKVLAKGTPELKDAVEKEEISLGVAEHIVSVTPPEQQADAIAEAKKIAKKKSSKASKAKRPKKTDKPSDKPEEPRPQWTPEEAARDKACLEIINAPSIYPQDAVISQHTNPSESGLRLAISWLRENEDRIASFKRPQCDEMLLRTNRIQGYHLNYHNFPRPDGPLDPRLRDWAQSLWLKRERQQTRLELAAKLRPSRQRRAPGNGGKDRPFEDRFKTFWMLIEDSIGLFRRAECQELIKAFRDEVKQFFSISGENRGAANVADAQKNGDS